jgi:hydrogenase nickel incorporation protein HypA/HybF
MHELSIALGIVDAVTEEARRRALPPVKAVHLRLGPLSGVVGEALSSAFAMAVHDTSLADATLVIEDAPITVRCPRCCAVQPVVSMQDVRCAACGTSGGEVVTGRELMVVALEVENEPADAPG